MHIRARICTGQAGRQTGTRAHSLTQHVCLRLLLAFALTRVVMRGRANKQHRMRCADAVPCAHAHVPGRHGRV
eukprot:2988584-Alexandrium_andersonii.AAC.1